MTLGEIYTAYDVYIGSFNKMPIKKHKGTVDNSRQVDITDWDCHEYSFSFDTEVEVIDGKFYIGQHRIGFMLKRVELTAEMMDQATVSGGYVAVDARAKKRTRR